MPAAFNLSVDPLELDTAPASGMRRAASSSMRKFTVDPVPTPSTLPGSTNSSAARAAACFPVFCEAFTRCSSIQPAENDNARLRRAVYECENGE